jgi:hypothetical protein
LNASELEQGKEKRRGRKPVDHAGEIHGSLKIITTLESKNGNSRVEVECRCGHPDCMVRFSAWYNHLKRGLVSCRKRTELTLEAKYEAILERYGLAESPLWTMEESKVLWIKGRREAENIHLRDEATIAEVFDAATHFRPAGGGKRTATKQYEEAEDWWTSRVEKAHSLRVPKSKSNCA